MAPQATHFLQRIGGVSCNLVEVTFVFAPQDGQAGANVEKTYAGPSADGGEGAGASDAAGSGDGGPRRSVRQVKPQRHRHAIPTRRVPKRLAHAIPGTAR